VVYYQLKKSCSLSRMCAFLKKGGLTGNMKSKRKPVEPIPEEFSSYEKAAEFWDTHDTTDYLEESHPVTVKSEFRGRHYEIEIEASVAESLRSQARRRGVSPSHLASDLLRQQLMALDNATATA